VDVGTSLSLRHRYPRAPPSLVELAPSSVGTDALTGSRGQSGHGRGGTIRPVCRRGIHAENGDGGLGHQLGEAFLREAALVVQHGQWLEQTLDDLSLGHQVGQQL